MPKEDNQVDIKLFKEMLKPSTASAILSVLGGVLLCIGVIFLTRYKYSSIRQGYLDYHAGHHLTLSFLNKSIFSTGIIGNSLIFAFWLVAGILVYIIAVDIVKAIKSTIETEKELTYVNLDRHYALRYTMTRIFIRVMTLIIWTPYLYLFFRVLLPSAVYLAIAASGSSTIEYMPIFVILSIALTAVAIHINVVLFRLLLLRPRVIINQIL